MFVCFFFFFKQKTAYEMRISDWSSDVCSSDLLADVALLEQRNVGAHRELPACTASAHPLQADEIPSDRCVRGAGCLALRGERPHVGGRDRQQEIGRASCRERVCQYV